jgi:hypothetical protein
MKIPYTPKEQSLIEPPLKGYLDEHTDYRGKPFSTALYKEVLDSKDITYIKKWQATLKRHMKKAKKYTLRERMNEEIKNIDEFINNHVA